MTVVKCVHCGTDNDPVATAGYCDDCGKKLPGNFPPPRSAFLREEDDEVGLVRTSAAGRSALSPTEADSIKRFPPWRTGVGWVLKLAGVGIACLGFLGWIVALLRTGVAHNELLGTFIGLGGCLAALGWFVGTPAAVRRVQGPPNLPSSS